MPYAINDNGWRAVGEEFTEADLMPGETLVAEIPQWLIDRVAANEVLRMATDRLNALVRQANAQITAIKGRIDLLDWLINIQTPEDQEEAGEEYTPPTAEDIAELAALKPRYTKWNSYSVKLGKVKTQATWPTAPVWPVMPEPYTTETSATAPAVA